MDTKSYPISGKTVRCSWNPWIELALEVWVRLPSTENTSCLVFGKEGVYKLGLEGCVGVPQSKW